MSTVENSLKDKYVDYLDLLKTLCDCYDSTDKEVVALSISTAIRVLVHDTERSTSLLNHLGRKSIAFFSTNFREPRERVHLGLVRRINVGVKDGMGGEAKYWPLCSEKYFPMPKHVAELPFDQWWSSEIIFDGCGSTLTRRELVLAVCNKDGGAHFDVKVQQKYDDFRHSWSGGSTVTGISSGKKRGYDNIPIYPAIRQIGYELLCTLKP